MIPPLLHQTWKSATLPDEIARYCASWIEHNPAIERRFYDDDACLDVVRRSFPAWFDAYQALPFPVQKADFFRYLIVYRDGGFYADVDMECLRPMDRFLAMDGALFSVEAHLTETRRRELGYRRPYQLANCIFAAEPRHPFLLRVIERVAQIAIERPARSRAEVEDTTGPRMLTRAFYDQPAADVRLLEQIYWMAPDLYAAIYPFNVNIHARHRFWGSWKGAGAKLPLRRRLIERNRPPPPFPRHVVRRIEV
jgi:mannosyltransferase OCH1-like enzyme